MKTILKRALSVLLTLTMLGSMFMFNVSASSAGQITASTVNCTESTTAQEAKVEISIANNPGLTAMQLNVEFNSNYLTLNSVTDGGILDGPTHMNTYNSPYTLTWSNDLALENNMSTGVIATLNFTVAANTPAGEYPINITCVQENTYNCNFEDAVFTVTNGKIAVAASSTHTHSYGAWTKVDDSNHERTCECGAKETEAHTWDAGVVTKQPTHTETGEKTYTCTACNATKTEVVDKTTEHTYGAWTKVDDKNHERTCECGAKETAEHTWNEGVVTTQPTHTSTGIKTYTCTVCKATKTEEVAKTPEHKYGAWTKVDDNNHERTCECGAKETAEHTWDEGTVADGVKTYTCTACGATKTEIVEEKLTLAKAIENAKAYVYDDYKYTVVSKPVVDGDAATIKGLYTEDNYNPGAMNDTARFLGALYRANDGDVEKLTYKDVEYIWNADKELLGSNWADADGKTLVSAIVTAATQNNETSFKIGVVGLGTITFVVEVHIHKFGDWTSADADNHKKVCECGEEVVEAHTVEVISAVDATCDKNGLTKGKKCSVCKTIIEPQKLVAKLGHSLVKTDEVASTCIAQGHAAYWTCKTCEKMYADEAATVEIESAADVALKLADHVMSDWVTSNDGNSKTRTCTIEGCDYSETAEIDDECAHDGETIDEITKAPTCTETGLKNVICKRCYEVIEEDVEVNALGHIINTVQAQAATCTEDGYEAYYICGECDAIFSDLEGTTEIEEPVVVPATGHDWSADAVDGIKTCVNGCGAKQKVIADATINAENLDEAVMDERDEVLKELGYDVTHSLDVEETTADDTLKNKIEELINKEIASIPAFVVDITVTKNISNTNDANDSYDEAVTETRGPIEIKVTIPSSIRGKGKYRVVRLHGGVADEITTTANAAGEYISLENISSNVLTLFVKKFSQYAIVGEDVVVAPPIGGGGGSSTYTVRFNSNGGSAVKSISVKKNGTVTEPTAPTKEGYGFAGWYTDSALTKAYDFSTAVTKTITLYAKWNEVEKDPEDDKPGTDEPVIDEPATGITFSDVKANDWFYDSVKFVVDNKLMNGVSATNFAPNDSLTRAMLVTILFRNEGEVAVNKSIPFSDVDMGSYYAEAVIWAKQHGIVNGATENEFAPDANITREQIAAIMHRYAQYKGFDVTVGETADITSYTDAAAVSEYAVDAMKYVVGNGLINGKTATTLNPADNATRAEIAAILQRFITNNSK